MNLEKIVDSLKNRVANEARLAPRYETIVATRQKDNDTTQLNISVKLIVTGLVFTHNRIPSAAGTQVQVTPLTLVSPTVGCVIYMANCRGARITL